MLTPAVLKTAQLLKEQLQANRTQHTLAELEFLHDRLNCLRIFTRYQIDEKRAQIGVQSRDMTK